MGGIVVDLRKNRLIDRGVYAKVFDVEGSFTKGGSFHSDLVGNSKLPAVTTIKQVKRLTVGFIDRAGVVWDQQ